MKKVKKLVQRLTHDEKLMMAMLLDGAVKLTELETGLRKLLRCRDFIGTRCRYANLHPSQKMCEACVLDQRLDEVMRLFRDAVSLTKR